MSPGLLAHLEWWVGSGELGVPTFQACCLSNRITIPEAIIENLLTLETSIAHKPPSPGHPAVRTPSPLSL